MVGCASFPPPRAAGDLVSRRQREEVLARLQIREGQIRSLRGIAVVEVTLDQETRSFREAVALRNDGRFRLETLGAVGLPVLIIASDGDQMAVRSTSSPRGSSPDPRDMLARLLGLELPPATLVRLLAGLAPRPVPASALVFYLPEQRTYLLENESNGSVQRLYLDPSGALLGGEIWEEGEGLRFAFSAVREVEGISVPWKIRLTQVRRPVSITVAYQAIDINPILADPLFSFPLSTPAKEGGS